jgi:uncharacterized BrkB/YihY/UPF0761 family membrane protein
MDPKGYWGLLKEAGNEWLEDKAPRLGAALAYYSALSIAPLLVIAIFIAGMVLKDRFLSLAMVLGFGFLLLVSLILSTALTALATFFAGLMPAAAPVTEAVNFVVLLAVTVLLFAMIFKLLPDAKIAWGDVWVGAAITAVLFTLGKFLLGLYLGRSGISSTYGAAGSVVALLIWVYYSAQIVFFGAEFTKVYANRFGSRIVPAADAVPLTAEARAEQGMPRTEDVEARPIKCTDRSGDSARATHHLLTGYGVGALHAPDRAYQTRGKSR